MQEALLPSRTFTTEHGDFVSISRPPVDEFSEWLEFKVERSENGY